MATNSNLPTDAGRFNAFYLSPLRINFRFPDGTDLDNITIKAPGVRADLLPEIEKQGVLFSVNWTAEQMKFINQYFSVFLFNSGKAIGGINIVVHREAGEMSETEYTILNNLTDGIYFISEDGETAIFELGNEAVSQDGTYDFLGVTLNTLDILTN